MNHLFEVQYMEKMNRCMNIRKINKNEYVILDGEFKGEIREFNHIENRSQDFNSVRQSFKKIRYYINNNFHGGKNELFITLTYAENMTDTKRLYKDFDKFIKKLKYFYSKKNISFEYFSCVEPQGRGAWHCHCLFKFNTSSIYIDNSWLRDIWGHGFVNIHRIENVDNIGAYFTAYLADFVIDENISDDILNDVLKSGCGIVEKEIFVNGEKINKKVVKGGRLCMYPPGLNIYRKSKGIIFPNRYDTSFDKLKNGVLSSSEPVYTKGYEMVKPLEDDEHFNTIIYECYNLKRK